MCDVIKTTRARDSTRKKSAKIIRISMMSVILRARDENEREVSQVGECPICALYALFSRE